MMNTWRREVVFGISFLCCTLLVVGTASNSYATDDESDTAAAEESEESESPGEYDDSQEQLTLDGTDEDSFNASWEEMADALSEEERHRFNVSVIVAGLNQFYRQNLGEDEMEVEKVLEALDGETSDQVIGRAETLFRRFTGFDIDNLTPRMAEAVYEDFGFGSEEGLVVASIVDFAQDEFAEGAAERVRREANQIRQMVESYYVSYGELPENLEQLSEGDTPMIETLPTDPWDNEYLYRVEGERSFSIISKGADGEEGTDEDLVFDE